MPVDRYEFGGLLFSIFYEYSKVQRFLCRDAGLYSGQPRILTILKDNEGCTLSELSELCGIGMPSLSVSVRNMEKSGLIRRETFGKNNRIQLLHLTETGLKKAQAFHEAIDRFYMDLLSALGDEGSESMQRCMLQLKEYLVKYNNTAGNEE